MEVTHGLLYTNSYYTQQSIKKKKKKKKKKKNGIKAKNRHATGNENERHTHERMKKKNEYNNIRMASLLIWEKEDLSMKYQKYLVIIQLHSKVEYKNK